MTRKLYWPGLDVIIICNGCLGKIGLMIGVAILFIVRVLSTMLAFPNTTNMCRGYMSVIPSAIEVVITPFPCVNFEFNDFQDHHPYEEEVSVTW
jgi:hypothetical protein